MIAPIRKAKTDPEPNFSVANYLAQELDDDGRVSPIVWGMTDPVFRDAAMAGKLLHTPDYPDRKISLEAAAALNLPFVLAYTTDLKNGNLVAHAQLLVDGKEVWKDDEQVGASHAASINTDDSAASVAHTWALKMETSALKYLKAQPKKVTPALAKGQDPPKVEDTAPQDTTADLQTRIHNLVAKDQIDQAMVLARDAIDAHPLDAGLRVTLVRLLERDGQPAEAAHQALLASDLIPDNRELRLVALQDLLASDQKDQAKEQMNEIVARHPNEPSTLLLQGQTELALGSPEQAMDPLDHLARISPSPECYYWRGFTRALLGGAEGVQADAAAYQKSPLDPAQASSAYFFAMDILAGEFKKLLDSIPAAIQQESVHPDSPEVAKQIGQFVRQSDACVGFLSGFPGPTEFKNSHAQRLLALKLLKIALLDLQDYAKSPSDDVMTDARINLGEAMNQSKAADSSFEAERGTKHGVSGVANNP